HLERNNKRKTAKLSDASETAWRVKIDGRRLSDGWENFAVAHDLRVGDIVIFRHEGELVCSAIQYGGGYSDEEENLCNTEKVSIKKKRPKAETDPSTDQSFFITTVTASNLKRDVVFPKTFAMLNGLMKRFETIGLTYESCRCRFNMSRGWRSFYVANKKKPHSLAMSVTQGKLLKKILGVETNRNDTSQSKEAIKKRTRSKATIKEENITTSQNRFVTLTATPTCRLNLPLEFTKGNGINKARKITMRDRFGIKWSTVLLMNKNERRTMSLGRNWKGFCEFNDVKMGESFVLELVWENTVPVLNFCSKR
ncbi:hypothetical protein BRARA_D01491, partial [Brassica rapa]